MAIDRVLTGLDLSELTVLPSACPVAPEQVDLTTRCGDRLTLALPIISSPMDTVTGPALAVAVARAGGLGILHRHHSDLSLYVAAADTAVSQGAVVGAAVGTGRQWRQHVSALIRGGVGLLAVDAAHGDPVQALDMIGWIRSCWPGVEVMSHNLVTGDAAAQAIEAGCTSIRVGLTSGSINRTGHRLGVGRSLGSSLIECAVVARSHGVPMIADGGIRGPAHVVAALALGADAVMLGRLLAATREAPGSRMIDEDGRLHKLYRGMSSAAVWDERPHDSQWEASGRKIPEGTQRWVDCALTVKDTLNWIADSVREGMGLAGCRTVHDLWSARLERNAR